MTLNQVKKKHGFSLKEELIYIQIPKLDSEIKEDKVKYFECYLRQPIISDYDRILPSLNKPYTTASIILNLLWLEGDEEIKTNKRLIKSSTSLSGNIMDGYASDNEKITEDGELKHKITLHLEDDKDTYIILRDPTLEEEENITIMMSERPLTSVQTTLTALYIDGDKEIINDPKMVLSCLSFINELYMESEIIIEKK